MAVPILPVVAFDHFNRDLDRSLARLALSPPALATFEPERTKLAAAQPPPVLGPGASAALSRAIDEAFVYSFRRIMLIAAALGGASALVGLLVIAAAPARPAGAPRVRERAGPGP